jgi:3-oxoacyl-[acyl-carrier protein] reductase
VRNALVTGVDRSRGIGYAIARRLAEGGARVVTHGLGDGDISVDIVADFADPDAPARVIASASPLDVLVVNHALDESTRLEEMTAEQVDAHLQVNVRASLLLVKEFAAQFEGERGSVVLLTSGAHLGPMPGKGAYAVSKGALAIAAATLADELADRGIRVNAVDPGPTNTGYLDGVDPTGRMPFGRWGEPDDAARLVAWLCSEDGRWVTGEVLNSRGGFRG